MTWLLLRLSYLRSGQISDTALGHPAVIGELSLSGDVRPARGIIGKLLAGKALGFTRFFILKTDLEQAKLVPHITLLPTTTLREFYQRCAGGATITPFDTKDGTADTPTQPAKAAIDMRDIVGQERPASGGSRWS